MNNIQCYEGAEGAVPRCEKPAIQFILYTQSLSVTAWCSDHMHYIGKGGVFNPSFAKEVSLDEFLTAQVVNS